VSDSKLVRKEAKGFPILINMIWVFFLLIGIVAFIVGTVTFLDICFYPNSKFITAPLLASEICPWSFAISFMCIVIAIVISSLCSHSSNSEDELEEGSPL